MPFHTVVEAAYVANINRHLDNTQNINSVPFGSAWLPQNQDPSVTPKFDGTTTVNTNLYRPYPSLDRYQLAEWGGTANYNSLQFTANRRMARNLTFGVSYSFSKALGTADQIYNSGDIPGNVRAANYGRLAYDRTNSMVISYTYTLPRPIRGASFVNNFATRSLLNDWQVSGITSFVSGAPASVGYNVSGVTLSNVITGNPDYGPRPIIIGNSLSSDRNLMQWFNTAAFNPAIKGSTANDSGLNYLTLPGRNNTDLTIFKNVPFTGKEGRYIQFRLEGYNAFNHTQWSGVNTTATFASITSNVITNLPLGIAPGTSNGGRFGFGAANGTAGARIVQIALKVYF